ncbi:hypothetical protein GQ43DRAFT_374613 [Delitschia confertaspora ATCC 74209]|uniref:Sin3 binding protein n=1 Tax=Delitschia confertaspora ATCC 74209 TaxID=1513339 RepID=A0A9P4JPB6_9PLEO|nr:hypothetical protein GQ43DRAFT_374613 [Delitschia confertaspora ATCC 74209]
MATFVSRPVSNIAVAFAAHSHPDGANHHPSLLLTPPHSISPTLPPHKHRPGHAPSPARLPSHGDSDIDLQDAVEHAAAQDQPTALSRAALSGLEATAAITPTMLAQHHLPEILLSNGPIAIRHVLNHLAQSVPGFSRIPPAKARRLVVAALESRGGGGIHGEVEFDKVGWGRWDARMKGQPPRDGRPVRAVPIGVHGSMNSGMSPPASISESYPVPSIGELQTLQYKRDIYSGSWAGDSGFGFRDEEMSGMNMAEHEADKMSLDGSESDSDSPSDMSGMEDNAPGLEDDLDDVTDHEDWSAIGPDALRQASQASQSYGRRYAHRDYNYLSRTSAVRLKPQYRSVSAQSLPLSRAATQTPAFNTSSFVARTDTGPFHASSTGVRGAINQDIQERDAIEALLKMGSM